MKRKLAWMTVLGLLVLAPVWFVWGQPKDNRQEEDKLQKRAEAFVAAFNKGDAAALAGFWTPDVDYVLVDGRHLKGREAIEKAFKSFFSENKGVKLHITITSLRLVKPDLAIEDGATEVLAPDGRPGSMARYTIVHVKQDGEWMLASVRAAPFSPPSNHEHLQELEWLTGDWVDEAEKGEVARVSFSWAENRNFLVSTFTTTLKDVPVSGGVIPT